LDSWCEKKSALPVQVLKESCDTVQQNQDTGSPAMSNNSLHNIQNPSFWLAMRMSTNIFLTFSANTTTKLPTQKVKLFIDVIVYLLQS